MSKKSIECKAEKDLDSMLSVFLGDNKDQIPAVNEVSSTKRSAVANKIKRAKKSKGGELTLKQKTFVNAFLDKDNPSTYGNKTQSAIVAYNISPDNPNLAGQVGYRTANKDKVINYMEQRCEEMGIGVEVRLGTLQSIAKGQGTTKTIIKHRTKDVNTGKLKTTRIQEVLSPPRIHDRIVAIKEINNMTGYYKQQEIDKHVALAEVNAMYKAIVGTGAAGDRGERGVDV